MVIEAKISVVRILLVEDDPTSARFQIEAFEAASCKVLGAPTEVCDLLPQIDADPPDLVVIDLHLGHGKADGLHLASEIRQANPALPIVICTSSEVEEDAARAFRAGIRVYLTKRWLAYAPAHEIAAAIAFAREGARLYQVDFQIADLPSPLSERQLEAIRGRATGLSHREIAAQMFCSVKTVEHHLRNARQILGVRTDSALRSVATERGLVASPEAPAD
jgi:DNA-binding NarL/FixJ family response regulator